MPGGRSRRQKSARCSPSRSIPTAKACWRRSRASRSSPGRAATGRGASRRFPAWCHRSPICRPAAPSRRAAPSPTSAAAGSSRPTSKSGRGTGLRAGTPSGSTRHEPPARRRAGARGQRPQEALPREKGAAAADGRTCARGGRGQRICIARALALNPRLIVADEPVSALDVSIQAQVINLMMGLQQEKRLSYLFIAHNLAVVEHISHRVAVMYLGKIVEYADKKSLFLTPLHPYTEALLSAVPVPNPKLKRAKRLLAGDVPSPMNPPPGCAFHTRCPYVEARCRTEAPRLQEVAPGHWVSCHRHEAA